jgi:DNA-directed RNA polymerase subunit RPC12/RpoP
MQRSWTENAIWNLNSKKWNKWCVFVSHLLFNNCFGAGHLTYLCSQWVPVFQISYFMIDWSIYRLFVLNMGCKRDSLQMMIFLYVCSKCSVVELKTRFENWIERSDVNGVYCFHFSYLITVLAYLCSQLAPLVQIRYFIFDWSIYRLFVLNRLWKRDSLQMMIFVYVCLTCSVVDLKTRLETWNARNDVNGVYWFHLSYLITVLALFITVKCAHNGH